jgi:hypothetical protein
VNPAPFPTALIPIATTPSIEREFKTSAHGSSAIGFRHAPAANPTDLLNPLPVIEQEIAAALQRAQSR